VFEHLERQQYAQHAAQECPKCGTRRFRRVNGKLQAVKRFYDMRVERLIEAWFRDRRYAANFGRTEDGKHQAHSVRDPTAYLGTPAGKMLDKNCKGFFSQGKHAGLYAIGACRG